MRHMRTREVEEGEKDLKQLIVQWLFSISPGCSKGCREKKEDDTSYPSAHVCHKQFREWGRFKVYSKYDGTFKR